MTLSAEEFTRRFLLHSLPRGFQRIRHFGLFANPVRKQSLALCRQLLNVPVQATPSPVPLCLDERYEALTGHSLLQCPVCKTPTMVLVEQFLPAYPFPFEDSC